MEGSIESFYKSREFKAEEFGGGKCVFQYQYLGAQPQLTYQARQRTIVLCAEIPVLEELFSVFVYDRNVFSMKAASERQIMDHKRTKLKDRFFSRRLDLTSPCSR